MNLKEMGGECLDWIKLAEISAQCRDCCENGDGGSAFVKGVNIFNQLSCCLPPKGRHLLHGGP
jgi:hypothetical protein